MGQERSISRSTILDRGGRTRCIVHLVVHVLIRGGLVIRHCSNQSMGSIEVVGEYEKKKLQIGAQYSLGAKRKIPVPVVRNRRSGAECFRFMATHCRKVTCKRHTWL